MRHSLLRYLSYKLEAKCHAYVSDPGRHLSDATGTTLTRLKTSWQFDSKIRTEAHRVMISGTRLTSTTKNAPFVCAVTQQTSLEETTGGKATTGTTAQIAKRLIAWKYF
ncbi:putative uncharacterized protein [Pseudomonas sp. StFLB209]|nr:putative uncharacterized protein [Pseudomonas sp. StFLB209]